MNFLTCRLNAAGLLAIRKSHQVVRGPASGPRSWDPSGKSRTCSRRPPASPRVLQGPGGPRSRPHSAVASPFPNAPSRNLLLHGALACSRPLRWRLWGMGRSLPPSFPHPLVAPLGRGLEAPTVLLCLRRIRPVGSAAKALCARAPTGNKSDISLPRVAVRTAPSVLHSGHGGKPGFPLPPNPAGPVPPAAAAASPAEMRACGRRRLLTGSCERAAGPSRAALGLTVAANLCPLRAGEAPPPCERQAGVEGSRCASRA